MYMDIIACYLNAIEEIIQNQNVRENIQYFVKIVNAVENGNIELEEFKVRYSDRIKCDDSIKDLLDLILSHDKIKTLYLIKGFGIIVMEKDLSSLSKIEREKVHNLYRTAKDNGLLDSLERIIKEAGYYKRYLSIIKEL